MSTKAFMSRTVGPATIAIPEFACVRSDHGGGSDGSWCECTEDRNGVPHTRGTHHNRIEFAHEPPNNRRRREIRVALYSHDTLGLGHLRRNLLIAQALTQSHLKATNLLVTGAYESNFFSLPEGTDCFTLPRLQKDVDGSYASGQWAMSIGELLKLRSEAIHSALTAYEPDLFIVDKVPGGAFGELLPTLRSLKERGTSQCILGLRDILDDPETVAAEWNDLSCNQVIDDYYDSIWIYGDQQVYDPVSQYNWSSRISHKVHFTGYLDQRSRISDRESSNHDVGETFCDTSSPLFLCALGGGKDGFRLAEVFIQAVRNARARGIVLAGPFMSRELYSTLKLHAEGCSNLRVLDFAKEADQLVHHADGVVAMAGYNTVASILSFNKPAVLVPRVHPRQEQWIRASRMAELGLVDVLHPDSLTPHALESWFASVKQQNNSSHIVASATCKMDGLDRIVSLASQMLVNAHSQHIREANERL